MVSERPDPHGREPPAGVAFGDPDPGGVRELRQAFRLGHGLVERRRPAAGHADLGVAGEVPALHRERLVLGHADLNLDMRRLAFAASPFVLMFSNETPSKVSASLAAKSANSFHHLPLIGRST